MTFVISWKLQKYTEKPKKKKKGSKNDFIDFCDTYFAYKIIIFAFWNIFQKVYFQYGCEVFAFNLIDLNF